MSAADEDAPLPETSERLQLSRRTYRQVHRHPVARLVSVRDATPGQRPQCLERDADPDRVPILGEALATKPREIQQNRRREAASVKVRHHAFGQGLLDRVGVPPELEGDDDISKEPLEQQALEDARLALEALAIGAREPLFLEADPEEVGTPGHPLGKGRSDAGRCRLDASIIAPESLNQSHSGSRLPPQRTRYLARLSQEPRWMRQR